MEDPKDKARRFIQTRAKKREPLPDQKELKRQLGFDLIKAANEKGKKK